ncbi:MAG: hypothetical protein NC411_06180 [Bacteroides sp.]|nr:hypothetical protein [Bacteroides sp.]
MISAMSLSAQDKVEAEIKADFVSQYIWRGQDMGDFSLQPTLGVAWRGLSLTAWGSTGISDSDDTREFDLTLGYSIGGLSFGVTDYWFDTPNSKYFVYAAHRTSHVFEANVGYDFGPVSIGWYTNFAGNDGVTRSGKRAYSSYVEVSAPFSLGGLSWCATLGAVPYATSFYADVNGFAVVNASLSATYDIKVTDSFSIPIFATINTNPCTQKAFFVAGFTLRP